jgi:hypothetical protein
MAFYQLLLRIILPAAAIVILAGIVSIYSQL